MGPAGGMLKYLGRGASYAKGVGRNVSSQGEVGPRAGAQKPTAEGYKQPASKDGIKRYQDKDATIRSKAGAIDGVTNPKAALAFVDDET